MSQTCTLQFVKKPEAFDPFIREYKLPGNEVDIHICGLSGGIDSTATALMLRKNNPGAHIIWFFTDTGDEPQSVMDQLDLLETYLGDPIVRIKPPKDLRGLIDQFNGFLPSSGQRWCTRMLKIEPFEKFINELKGQYPCCVIHSYVGLRADEPGRTGYVSEDGRLMTHFPLREIGATRKDVFLFVSKEFHIPKFYGNGRSRSGCKSCYSQRKGEFIQSIQRTPKEFAQAMSIERLSGVDLFRYADNPDKPVLSKKRNRYLWYPAPPTWDFDEMDFILASKKESSKVAKRNKSKSPQIEQLDLLASGSRSSIWVAVEYTISGSYYVGKPFVAFSEIVAISRSKAGVQQQVNSRFIHRLDTLWILEPDEDSLRDGLRYGVFEISAPDDRLEVLGPVEKNSYTLHKDFSLKQASHWVAWAKTSLFNADELGCDSMGKYPMDSNQAMVEQSYLYKPKDPVLANDYYDPREDLDEENEAEGQFSMCVACSK